MAGLALIRPIVDFALPPRCASCGAIVPDEHSLCVSCWSGLDFLTGPGCATCGAPVAAADMQCGPCLLRPPDHDGVRAAVAYGDVARTIVLRLKHGRRIALARFIGGVMARALDAPADSMLIPVPLHRWRIWGRGFNQSQALAHWVADGTGLPVLSNLLIRSKRTPMLGGLGATERARALAGAFATTAKIDKQPVVLIDDVYTSGATANACARALKRAGASSVIVLCWARVLRGD